MKDFEQFLGQAIEAFKGLSPKQKTVLAVVFVSTSIAGNIASDLLVDTIGKGPTACLGVRGLVA